MLNVIWYNNNIMEASSTNSNTDEAPVDFFAKQARSILLHKFHNVGNV